MKRRLSLYVLLSLVLLPATTLGKDIYLSIAGSVGAFRTDSRIFNPSGTKDIIITATFLPRVGESTMTRVERTITVPKRQMVIFDDVVSSLFEATGLGAIKLSSPDDFVATSRIYAAVGGGTLGQFVAGQDGAAAKTKGVLIQLKSNSAFRTNTGFVNPNTSDATVAIRQYDRNNAAIDGPMTVTVPAMSVVFPVGAVLAASAADFGDAWISFESTQPVFAFGSVVDNTTTDPTFIAAFEDTGTAAPPQPQTKTFDVTARQWQFDVSPGGGSILRVAKGDRVILRLNSVDVQHGLTIQTYLPGERLINPGQQTVFEFVADREGTFPFACTVPACGRGHTQMLGQLIVGTEPSDRPGY